MNGAIDQGIRGGRWLEVGVRCYAVEVPIVALLALARVDNAVAADVRRQACERASTLG